MIDLEENMALVPFTINRYFPALSCDEDAMQEGYIALWRACETYNPSKTNFSTYAVRCIKNRLIGYSRKRVGQPTAAQFLSLSSCPACHERSYIARKDTRYDEVEIEMLMCDFRKRLRPSQIELLDLLLSGYNRHQIARKCGCTHQNIAQKCAPLKRELRNYLYENNGG